jgi:predicted dehydrogenase
LKKLGIGIIGLGVGMKHLQAYKLHNHCDVRIICDFSDEKLRAAKACCPDALVAATAEELISSPDIDVVSIASYDNFHFDQIKLALEHEKAVFVEKPMCLFRYEAEEIKRILNKSKQLRLSSNFPLRTAPLFQWLRAEMADGSFGQMFYLEGDYLWGRIEKLSAGWRRQMEYYSIVHGAAIHMIDLLMWMTEKTPTTVQAYGNSISTTRVGFSFRDFVALLLQFEDGMIVKITGNGGCVHPHTHKVQIFGTEKTFILDLLGARLINGRNPEQVEIVEHEYPGEQKDLIIRSFVDSILEKEKMAMVSVDDAFKTMSVCFAAEESLSTRAPVNIHYM